MRKYVLILVLLVSVTATSALAASFQSLFAPNADLWARWTENDPVSLATIDHAAWTEFLSRYRRLGGDGIARVAYASVTPSDRVALQDYINGLASLPIGNYARDEQFAFWINLYNALTVWVVLNAYPVESIRDIDISPGLFSNGPWGAELITIDGESVTLDDIEHRILRPIWRDPRIHYAVNCASLGCPNLTAVAFTASGKEAMLDEAARTYINSPRGVRVEGGRLIVSRIYDWFHQDFGSGDEAVIAHLRMYTDDALDAELGHIDEIEDYEYDWLLNDIP